MPRNNDVLIGNAAYGSLYTGNPVSNNLGIGGFFGWSPDLSNYLSEQAYVRKPLEIVVLETPKWVELMPSPEKWRASIRNLFERKAMRVEGFQSGLKVQTDDHAAGGSNEMFQEPVNVTRERTEPKFTFLDPYGRPIQRLHSVWIRMSIMDPEAKFAMLTTLGANTPTDLLADWRSASILAYEPSPTRRGVEKAWVTTNFYPLDNGPEEGVRDLTQAAEKSQLVIPYAGISAVGNGVLQFAEEIMNFTNLASADPFNKESFIREIAPDVLAVAQAGFKADAERTGASNVQPLG